MTSNDSNKRALNDYLQFQRQISKNLQEFLTAAKKWSAQHDSLIRIEDQLWKNISDTDPLKQLIEIVPEINDRVMSMQNDVDYIIPMVEKYETLVGLTLKSLE